MACKHPRLQDHTSPLQVLQVAGGDFLAAAAVDCAHESGSSQQEALSSQQFQEPMPTSNKRTPSICAGKVGATNRGGSSLLLLLRRANSRGGLIENKCVALSCVRLAVPWCHVVVPPSGGGCKEASVGL